MSTGRSALPGPRPPQGMALTHSPSGKRRARASMRSKARAVVTTSWSQVSYDPLVR